MWRIEACMEIVVATDGAGGLDAIAATDFGRGETFTIVSTENHAIGAVRVVENTGRRAAQGAGIVAAEQVADEGVDVAAAGHFGPHAEEILGEAGIVIALVPKVTVREAVERILTRLEEE
ncbi:dinitrogenase iron-molybdenum cofactor [Methanofollis formosanus]|uniref:Dinitrogenase iron-molybdenum cofactor n=2 Tax=Methanofollis formosanus TaxID=299308 RepID=A0A8G1A3T2_9EURY|nr:dinitrogenase iron-molybdenum cofactor [Methanofollis formosanus]